MSTSRLVAVGWPRDIAQIIAGYADYGILTMIRGIMWRDRLTSVAMYSGGNWHAFIHGDFPMGLETTPRVPRAYADVGLFIYIQSTRRCLNTDADCHRLLSSSAIEWIYNQFLRNPVTCD